MRRLYLTILGIFLCSASAHAAPPPSAPLQAARPATRIETDQKTGAMLFIVNGKEEARIDGNGIHSRDNVDYNGTLTDGSSVYPYKPASSAR